MEYKFLKIFNKEQKKKMVLLLIFMFFVSLIELLSIGSLLPIFSLIFNDQYMIKVNDLLDKFGIVNIRFEDHNKLIVTSLAVLFFIFTLKNTILIIFNWIQFKFLKNLTSYLSTTAFSIFINQPYEYFFNAKSSSLVRNINNEPKVIVKNLFTQLCIIIMETITLIGLIFFLVYVYGSNAGIILFLILFVIGLGLYFTRNVIKKWGNIRFKFEAQRIKSITQTFDNIKDIIIKKKIKFFYEKFKVFTTLTLDAGRFGSFYGTLPRLLIEQLIIILFIFYFIFYYNSQLLDENFFSKLIFLGAILIRLIPGLIKISTSYQAIKFATVSAKNMYEYFQLKKKKVLDSYIKIKFDKKIEFKELEYQFTGYDKKVLENINLVIKKNHTIGIIGKTGSGKTTLLDICLGLLKPTKGQILIDELDFTNNLNNSGWHKKIGYVSQHVTLIDDTIKNNIALGIPEKDIDINKINEVIKKTNLKEFIETLQNGIETEVGEKGVKLSGGQIQRIGIARAIYADPEILCFDEATSSLDYETEDDILKMILSVKHNKTIIIVAHRLKTIENCDQVIELSNGKIVKICKPNELLNNYS